MANGKPNQFVVAIRRCFPTTFKREKPKVTTFVRNQTVIKIWSFQKPLGPFFKPIKIVIVSVRPIKTVQIYLVEKHDGNENCALVASSVDCACTCTERTCSTARLGVSQMTRRTGSGKLAC